METFYRYMRKKHQILLVDDKPIGGQWNFDKENRKKWTGTPTVPKNYPIKNNVEEILASIYNQNIKYIGKIESHDVYFPINREQSIEVLDYFCNYLLPNFGTFEDAMHSSEFFLFHSRLSFALNTKMLHPQEVIYAAIQSWEKKPEIISLTLMRSP